MEKKFQIFISSTYEDLKEERAKLVATILKDYHFPIGMEMFSADNVEQWEQIRRTIDSSDYYVLVIKRRYGSMTKDGISYTEKEYKEDIDPKVLPDGKPMSIVKRCTWLAEYIDRIDNENPHGIIWQIIDDIKDIGTILRKLDDKYFTIDTCTIPVVEHGASRIQRII